MNVIFANFGQGSRIVPIKLKWNATIMHGHPYPMRLRPNRILTLNERTAVHIFCNENFGAENWCMFEVEDFVGFWREEQRHRFGEEFNVS